MPRPRIYMSLEAKRATQRATQRRYQERRLATYTKYTKVEVAKAEAASAETINTGDTNTSTDMFIDLAANAMSFAFAATIVPIPGHESIIFANDSRSVTPTPTIAVINDTLLSNDTPRRATSLAKRAIQRASQRRYAKAVKIAAVNIAAGKTFADRLMDSIAKSTSDPSAANVVHITGYQSTSSAANSKSVFPAPTIGVFSHVAIPTAGPNLYNLPITSNGTQPIVFHPNRILSIHLLLSFPFTNTFHPRADPNSSLHPPK